MADVDRVYLNIKSMTLWCIQHVEKVEFCLGQKFLEISIIVFIVLAQKSSCNAKPNICSKRLLVVLVVVVYTVSVVFVEVSATPAHNEITVPHNLAWWRIERC